MSRRIARTHACRGGVTHVPIRTFQHSLLSLLAASFSRLKNKTEGVGMSNCQVSTLIACLEAHYTADWHTHCIYNTGPIKCMP